MLFQHNQEYRNRYKKRHDKEGEEGFPCYDNEFNVIQYSIGFASLAYVFFHKNKSIPISADDGMMLVQIEFPDNIGEGEMREVKVGEGEKDKVLVSRYKGELYAVGAFCSHFGAPLVQGVLFDDKVLCPYHAAGFSVVTGAVDSAPGLDGVPRYEIVK